MACGLATARTNSLPIVPDRILLNASSNSKTVSTAFRGFFTRFALCFLAWELLLWATVLKTA
jgi:hypothetical protein